MQGDAWAQYNLTRCYHNGKGVGKDLTEAVRLYKSPADQGDADAQYNLAICYKNGKGVGKDLEQAKKYFSLAAERGLEEAKKALEELKRLEKSES